MAMRICVPRETHPGETRTAIVPENAAKLVKRGAEIAVEAGVGAACGYSDADYTAAGATVVQDRYALVSSADMVLRLRKPPPEEVGWLKKGCIHVSFLDPFNEPELVRNLAAQGVSAISMEMIPIIVTADIVAGMKKGSVIVDLPIESGGNVEGSAFDQIIDRDGVKIVALANLAGRVPIPASKVYSTNLLSLIEEFWDKETSRFVLRLDDEIIQGCLVTHDGQVRGQAAKG